jgi:aminopeptidase-like protein
MTTGEVLYNRAADLFPICRSLTGEGVDKTLALIQKHLPNLAIQKIPTGTQVFDWTIPQEWAINDAFIAGDSGERIVDFNENNLHVVGYSEPVDAIMTYEELEPHLYTLPDEPTAIPYVTSYYKRRWGFCLTENQKEALSRTAKYHIKIDSRLFDGNLTYGECIIRGASEQEVLLSTYICHPSMANNEVSGPVVLTALAEYLLSAPRRYTYRIIFIPETIGSIAYLSKHLEQLKERTKAGFVLTCVGDNRAYSYLSSRYGDTYADKVAKHVLHHIDPNFRAYSFLERGSDERQFCAPGVDLPVCSIMRTKYAEYPEYHTSLDNMSLISPEGLFGGYEMAKECIDLIESNYVYKNTVLCEPQMGKRGLYPTVSAKGSADGVRNLMNALAYADGTNDIIDIAELIGVPALEVGRLLELLCKNGVVEVAR